MTFVCFMCKQRIEAGFPVFFAMDVPFCSGFCRNSSRPHIQGIFNKTYRTKNYEKVF